MTAKDALHMDDIRTVEREPVTAGQNLASRSLTDNTT